MPPELIDIIINFAIRPPYIPIEYARLLCKLRLVSRYFYDRVTSQILTNSNIKSGWNDDKVFITKGVKKILGYSWRIKYLDKKSQENWCKHKVKIIAENKLLHSNQVEFCFKKIINKIQHAYLWLYLFNDISICKILDVLSKKSNLKSLELNVGVNNSYCNKECTEKIITTLEKNKKLHHISHLCLDRNVLDIKKLDQFMQALLNKKIQYLIFQFNPIYDKGAKIISKYLKSLYIYRLEIMSAELGNESVKILIENLPKGLRDLSLTYNNINKNGAEIFFKGLESTKIEKASLQGNDLSGYQADHLRETAKFSTLELISLYDCNLDESKSNFKKIKNINKKEIYISF